MSDTADHLLDLLTDLVGRARRAGADAAEATVADGVAVDVACRDGRVEHLERSEGGDLGLRVYIGRRMASVSSAERNSEALDRVVEQAVAMARHVPEDPFCGLADPDQLARDLPDLDLLDTVEPSVDTLTERARTVEAAALAVPRVFTSRSGANASWRRSRMASAASNGFVRSFDSSGSHLSIAAIAGAPSAMETDWDSASAVHAEDLDDPATVGRRAGERAAAALGARKLSTARLPVVFDPRVASSLLGHLAGAINGSAIARRTSFLLDARGTQVFADGVTIVDDPHIRRGLRSRPCDGEGLPNGRCLIVEDGRLTGWLLDLRSARQLGLAPTGHAVRGISGPPGAGTSNLWLEPGSLSPADLMADIADGFYVTRLMGMGVNGVTGDYSRGAAGFRIAHGELAYPVSEVTIAGNLKDMFRRLVPARDLERRYGVDAPTCRIDGMTVAGI
jgi:PmbA protein